MRLLHSLLMLYVKCNISHVLLVGFFQDLLKVNLGPPIPDYIQSVSILKKTSTIPTLCPFQVVNLNIVLISVNSVSAEFHSRAACVEFLSPAAGDLYVRHHRQGAGVWVTALWRHSHANTHLWPGTGGFRIILINILELKGERDGLGWLLILNLKCSVF